jgi:glycosyltransferase involved in cell wall biosynthesis
VNPEADLQTTHDMTPRVSVIVPVFNTAPYLARCLQSLRESALREIEIICVDDASTDESARIVEDFARLDSRIRLIRHERNLGLGGARNTGIAAARAEYIGGVDSDDWVAPTMYARLLEATDGGRADVVEGGYLRIDSAGEVFRRYKPKAKVVENDRNQINIFEVTPPSFCTKLWRRALFVDNGIWFPEHTFYEDLATTPRLMAKAKLIHFIADTSYFYFKRDGSITFSASERHQLDHFKVFDILLDFLWENDLVDRYHEEFAAQIGSRLTYHANNVVDFDVPEKDKVQYLRHMLMMTIGYQDSHAELHGASSEDLAGRFKESRASRKAQDIARLRDDIAKLEAKASALGQKVASLDKTLATERRKHRDLVSDPFWKLTALVRRLRRPARQAAAVRESSAK